ncbi:MAG: hypothetical protein IJD48_01520 [Clostridia bacterium]|nr:hypothetical protein [Clostridia bacterium]
MLGKLLKYDLKKNMRWLWILFASTILVAAITRGCKELAQEIMFFNILSIFFDSVFYALVINSIVQPFLRSFLNFSKSLYGDESYLIHTLPVTKNQIITSKFLTSLIEMLLGFASIVVSLLIMFASPTFFSTLKLLISTVVVGEFSLFCILLLFIILVIVEFLMFISIICFSIVLANKTKEKRFLKAFLITAALAFVAITVLSIFMIIVLLINGVSLSVSTLALSKTAFISILTTGIVVYSAFIILFFVLTKKEFNKGVNVD